MNNKNNDKRIRKVAAHIATLIPFLFGPTPATIVAIRSVYSAKGLLRSPAGASSLATKNSSIA